MNAGGLPRSGRVGMYPRAGPIPLWTNAMRVEGVVGLGLETNTMRVEGVVGLGSETNTM